MIIIISLILIAAIYKMNSLQLSHKMVIIGLIILLSGIGTMFLIPFTTRAIAREWMIKIRRSSTSYKEWRETKGDNTVKFYFFNLTNPVEFINGEKAKLNQVGPFTYRINKFKENILFHGKNRVSYNER